MQKIIKTKDQIIIDPEEIKSKLYRLTVGEQLHLETPRVTRIYERIL